MQHKFGCIANIEDDRDFKMAMIHNVILKAIDLEPDMAEAYDQLQLGSCTANAIAAAIQYERKKQGLFAYVPSRLYIYFYEREFEGDVNKDSGAMIRTGLKVVSKRGAPSEWEWPYDIKKFATEPSYDCDYNALKDRVLKYELINQTEESIKGCLSNKIPIVIGFNVPKQFESNEMANTGIMQMPKDYNDCEGGHCVLVVGYDEENKKLKDFYKCRNSYGKDWGLNGYFWMPKEMLLDPNLSRDFSAIQLIG